VADPAPIRVLVADDHPVYRDGVAHAIRAHPELDLVAECMTGPEALEQILELRPAVAVLDFKLPGMSAVEVLKAMSPEDGPTRTIILSAFSDGELVYEAVAAGAIGYLLKEIARDELCDGVIRAARGEAVFSHEPQAALAHQVRLKHDDGRPRLTPRESEILRMSAAGSTAREIAEELYLSPTTVKTHLQNAYEKLGVSNRAAAVAEAMRHRLLT
jgi:two-component system, NarL family, nitrate/nitrite response regulator NarL